MDACAAHPWFTITQTAPRWKPLRRKFLVRAQIPARLGGRALKWQGDSAPQGAWGPNSPELMLFGHAATAASAAPHGRFLQTLPMCR